MAAMRNEISAMSKLLHRSLASNHTFARSLGTTLRLYDKQEEKKQAEDTQDKKSETNESKDSKPPPSSDKKPLKKNKPDWKSYKEKRKSDENSNNGGPSPIFQAVLKYSLIFASLYAINRLLFSSSMHPTFSYKTFEQLLVAGEVKEVAIEPQSDRVTVFLHPGAVLNGTPIRSRFFVLNVPSIEHFEQRLREVEEKLGVEEGCIQNISYLVL